MPLPVLLVFSHLRWDFVYQRPQHLLSRLAGRWQVLFVEEPVHTDGPARLEVREHGPHLTVIVPHTPVAAPGFHDDQVAMLHGLLAAHLTAARLEVDVAWLYTPMALPLVQAVGPRCVVYDCMDELANFKDAPRQLRQRESALMKSASLVLTGGPSLYEAKRELNANVHCLPSAVDAAHYAPANLRPGCDHEQSARQLQGDLPRPMFGYFGVIDERLDLSLVSALADSHPEWSVVMAGPVVKIDPAALPQRSNIHWLGMQPYERLPYLLAGWDVCMMPFALNESTRFISPTKTLEYMAGEKPVVSTPVRDVVWLYGEAVEVAYGPHGFVQACERLLAETGVARYQRARDMLNMVSRYSWDRNADSVHRLVTGALADAQVAVPMAPATALAPARAAFGGAARPLPAATAPVPARVVAGGVRA